MDVTVVVGTYGPRNWYDLAQERAVPSAEAEGVPVIHRHANNLTDARNAGLAAVETEYVAHLDADDELEPGYVEELSKGRADLRAPAVRYVHGASMQAPKMPRVAGHTHACDPDCLPQGNWLIIGTAVRTQLLRDVGGWREFPVYEDWDAWLRCWLAGGSIEAIPSAVYRAHVRFDSRNRAPSMFEKNEIHHRIVDANFPQIAA